MHRRSPSLRRSQAGLRRSQAGLTLVELLVSMLILGFVLTLVSQAVYQVAQISRSAQAVTARLSSRWAGGWAAAPVIANLVIPEEVADNKRFEGGSARLAGYSTQPPFPGNTGIRSFVFELRSSRDGSTGTDLFAVEGESFGTTAAELLIASFEGRVEFAYVDAAGQVLPAWPPVTVSAVRDPPSLPSAVIVRDRGSLQALMWYGFQGGTVKPVPQVNPFSSGK